MRAGSELPNSLAKTKSSCCSIVNRELRVLRLEHTVKEQGELLRQSRSTVEELQASNEVLVFTKHHFAFLCFVFLYSS